MSKLSVVARASLLVLLTVTVAAGCSRFRKGGKLYSSTGQAQALEVPPDLDTTPSAAATASAVTASGTQQAAAQSQLGFAATGSRDEVFGRVGEALSRIEGLTITSRAQLLGAFDVTYQGASFLVRVTTGENGTFVSAVDPRGLPVTGDAPRKVIESLRASIVR
ncbi:hypothetical protein [Lysobacter humi (ex Lee et al. 2017)]